MARANMFLKLTGASSGVLSGEADEPQHAGEINISDWGWGMTSPTAVGSGAPTGRVRYDALYVVKQADTASTGLMSMMNNNELSTAVLSVRKAGGKGDAYDYTIVRLQRARIVAFKIESSVSQDGAPCLVERVEFTFRSIEVEYSMQSPTGEPMGSSVFVGDAYPD